jgi:hypothetical protein
VTKLPSQVSAVSPLGAAIDGAPVRRPRKPRSAPVLREVTSGMMCFCGERFPESRALEFMRHLRAEVGEKLDWADRVREKTRQREMRYRNKRYAEDPEYRERAKARARERYRRIQADPVRHREYVERQVVAKRRRRAAKRTAT